jgi:hypothetical protein
MLVKANARQTLFDIAIQEHGSAEAAFDILQENPALEGITVDLPEGTVLTIGTSENGNTSVRDFLQDEKIATGQYVPPAGTVIKKYGPSYDPSKYS